MPYDTKEILSLTEIFTKLLNDAPPEAWFALIGALTGSVLTLVGGWLTNRSSNQRLIIQLQNERDEKEKESMRLRHEELYVESRKYFDAIVIYYLPYRKVMEGELTFNQALDITIERSKSDHQPHRVKMLIDLYFPELKAEFDELMAVLVILNKCVCGYKVQYKTGNLDGSKWLEVFQPTFESFGKKSTECADRIAILERNSPAPSRKLRKQTAD